MNKKRKAKKLEEERNELMADYAKIIRTDFVLVAITLFIFALIAFNAMTANWGDVYSYSALEFQNHMKVAAAALVFGSFVLVLICVYGLLRDIMYQVHNPVHSLVGKHER